MKCPYCGEQNLIDSKFCAECGKPLSDDIPSYMLVEDESIWEKLSEMKDEITKSLSERNYKAVLSDKSNPITNMLIVFAAWLILRTVGIIPFIIIVRILAFLMGYTGLIFLMAMTYVYSTHQEEIMKKVEELKGVDYRKSIKELISESLLKEEEEIAEKPELTEDETSSFTDKKNEEQRGEEEQE